MTPAAAGDPRPQHRPARWPARAIAALAGALTVFAYAPFGWAGLAIVTAAVLFGAWHRADRPREAAWLGFAFGAGLFGTGVSWLFIALQTFGGMPVPLAAVAIAGLVSFLALYPALAGWVVVRFTAAGSAQRLIGAASAFVLTEWLRGYLFTGFPWLALGYSQLPESPLAGYAPLGGVWLVSLAVALIAALLAYAVDALEARRFRAVGACTLTAIALATGGALSRNVEWTAPSGAPLAVSLVQGNVAQEIKFDPGFLGKTYELYGALAEASRGKLIVLPESTFPIFADELSNEVVARLARTARERRGELLFGMFVVEAPPAGSDEPRIYNSVVSVGTQQPNSYRKRHLVPFGETIPAKPLVGWVMRNLLAIPIGDQTPGPVEQAAFVVGSETVAVNICYEDAFGNELRSGARTASLLVNVTNDAWYGRSIAARQHNQIAAMRALELGRPMLRATNTGITSAIGHDGRVIAELPWFTRAILEVEIAGRTGETLYLRHGDAIPLACASLLLVAAIAARRWRRSTLAA